MKRLVSLLLSCLLLSSCGTIVTPAKTPPEHLVSEAPPAQVLPAPGEMPELLPDSQEAGGENASEPSLEEGGGTPVETLPEPQRVVDPPRPMVALTFDDGPHAVYTDQILDILEEHGAVATFFEVARNLPKAPEVMQRAVGMGCEIGSHSYRHANLGKMDQAAQQADQAAADALFQEVLGTTPALLRPPYGSMNKTLKTTSGRSIVTWSIDTEDWLSKDADKVVALDAGADDYLTKPFSVEELLARIRVALRRVRYDSQKTSAEAALYENGDLKIDYAGGRACCRGAEMKLTPMEYKLLCLLAKNTGKVLTHNYIISEIWGVSAGEAVAEIPSLRVFMATLRKKLELDPSHPQYIQTHVGVGYRMIRQRQEDES